MSNRSNIVTALAAKLNLIDGTGPYTNNIFNNAYPKLRFWDEVQDFPSIYLTASSETREYLPNFKWGYLNISIKVYCRGEFAQDQLDTLLQDVEYVVDHNYNLVYDAVNGYDTTEMLITSISTDDGLLVPYAIGEMNLQVRYEIM